MHALLSPSSASRWLACTPSARLESEFSDYSSKYADEGTLAHALGELLIRRQELGMPEKKYEAALAKIQESEHYSQAMMDLMQDFAVFVIERFAAARTSVPRSKLYLEKRLILTDYVPEAYGTGDVGVVSDDLLEVMDYKHGKGVYVEAESNKQMMLYALGWLRDFDHLFDIKQVRMTIYQPRMEKPEGGPNITSWTIYVDELLLWAENQLKPRAALAYAGQGEFAVGDHCHFCKAKVRCSAFAQEQLRLAQLEFAEPEQLTDEQVVDVINRAKAFEAWIKAVKTYALMEAVKKGKKWPDMKLVEGRSNRKYTDQLAIIKILKEKEYPEAEYLRVEGVTKLEKLMGPKDFNAFLKDFIIKPSGAPTLVPMSNKKPELNSLEMAQLEFDNEDEFAD